MNAAAPARITSPEARAAPQPDVEAIRALFNETQQDFHRWSPGYNLHFGYWSRGMSVVDREPMLERMNEVAIAALRLRAGAPCKVVDLGCGAGATMRALARRHPRAQVTGVSVVREQIMLAMRLDRLAGLARRTAYVLSDFCDTWIGARSCDGALAVESFCYAPGDDKAGALAEAARLLKPGGRLCVIDGFLAAEPRGLLAPIYRLWCRSWAVPELARLDAFTAALARCGFEDIEVRDLFWNIAPSAAHIPAVATLHTVRELWRNRGHLSAWRWRHIGASWLSMVLGLCRGTFRYCSVTARRCG